MTGYEGEGDGFAAGEGLAGGHGHDHARDGGPQPTVYALQTDVELGSAQTPEEIRATLAGFADAFIRGLEVGGCRLIGHVKGVLESVSGGSLYFNATSFSGKVSTRGALTDCHGTCRLTLNAIVYAIDLQGVESAAQLALGRCFGRPAT